MPRVREVRGDGAAGGAGVTGVGEPSDHGLDRRDFLRRMSALTAAASAGGLAGVTPMGTSAQQPGPGAGTPAAGAGSHARPEPWRSRESIERALPDPARVRRQVAEPSDLSLAEAAALIRAGDLDPVDLVEAYLARIGRLDPALLAFNTVTAESARREARRLASSRWSGPLHGIPIALKDNYYTAGVPTTANSHIFAEFVPGFDATAWTRMKREGAILLGKTQMGPLATTAASTPDGERTTVNAWDPDASPGGSSSGSATAVAARMAAAATGTQTGGSITNPSEAQGLTGIKPTMGRVSLYGIIPLTYTRDHPGPLARDAMDAALVLSAMAGPDRADPRTQGLPPVPDLVRAATPVERGGRPTLRWPTRIGVPPGYLDEPEAREFEPDPDDTPDERRRRRDRFESRVERDRAEWRSRRRMLDIFGELGAEVVDVELPRDWRTLTGGSFNNVRLPERTEPFLQYLREDVRLFGVSLSPWINGLLMPGAEYLRGQRAKLVLLRRVLDDLFGQCDVVLQTRPVPFDIIGLPLIAFPTGLVDGRPSSALLGGLPYGEDRLLSVVAAYQSVTNWHRERPPEPGTSGAGGGAPGGGPSTSPPDRPRLDTFDVILDGE